MLIAKQLLKTFSTVTAVDEVSLQVGPGQILGLLGPNGAGKTTTIRLILNIIRPDSGEITFDGKPFSHHTQNLVGYLPEERGLYRKNRLLHTIIYFATLKGMAADVARQKGLQWLDRFGLTSFADRRVEELSKGNQQKVQFIISILHDPPYVVLDEPFSGLDPVNQIVFKDILTELKQQGKAIIFSTHIMEEAEKLCDSITLINRGRVILEGDLNEVKKRFGTNAVHIEFEGDGAFLRSMPYVKKAMVFENSAELELIDGVIGSTILPQLAAHLTIRKFELREPSLHSIFLDQVGHKRLAPTHPASVLSSEVPS